MNTTDRKSVDGTNMNYAASQLAPELARAILRRLGMNKPTTAVGGI
jgi:hypothetical protein